MKASAGNPDPLVSATEHDQMNACAGLKSTDRAAREEIFHRAYAIWEREGHPTDRQLSHWLQAETEVLGPVLGPTPSRTPMLSDTGMTGL